MESNTAWNLDWLNNAWVTGIAGGVLSGLIVFFITKWLFSDQSKKELVQKAISANREIVYAIRGGIPEGVIPTAQTVDSLRAATARRFELAVEMVFSREELLDELTKEVMDSSFISAKTKHEHCLKLREALHNAHQPQAEAATRVRIEKGRLHSSARLMGALSATMGTMAGVMFAAVAVISREINLESSFGRASFPEPLLLAVSTTAAAITVTFLVLSAYRYRTPKPEDQVPEALLKLRQLLAEDRKTENALKFRSSTIDKGD